MYITLDFLLEFLLKLHESSTLFGVLLSDFSIQFYLHEITNFTFQFLILCGVFLKIYCQNNHGRIILPQKGNILKITTTDHNFFLNVQNLLLKKTKTIHEHVSPRHTKCQVKKRKKEKKFTEDLCLYSPQGTTLLAFSQIFHASPSFL